MKENSGCYYHDMSIPTIEKIFSAMVWTYKSREDMECRSPIWLGFEEIVEMIIIPNIPAGGKFWGRRSILDQTREVFWLMRLMRLSGIRPFCILRKPASASWNNTVTEVEERIAFCESIYGKFIDKLERKNLKSVKLKFWNLGLFYIV